MAERDRMAGWPKLREGKIHLRCYSCGRRMSNIDRDEYDTPNAVLVEAECDKHTGSMEPPTFYYDASGTEIRPDDDDPFFVAAAPDATQQENVKS